VSEDNQNNFSEDSEFDQNKIFEENIQRGAK